jgi:mannan endo-1,4-beta-mannosidase
MGCALRGIVRPGQPQARRCPLVQLDPAGVPLAAITAGDYDSYLRSYADSVRRFGGPVVIGFGYDMNSSQHTWGYGHTRPRTFITAWRHIVTLFCGQRADNVTWL